MIPSSLGIAEVCCNPFRLGHAHALEKSTYLQSSFWVLDFFFYKRFAGLTTFLANPSLAWAELRMFLAKVIWHFDVALCAESENWIVGQKTYISYQKDPMRCKFTPATAGSSGISSASS